MMVKEVDIKHEKGTAKGILYKNKLSFGGSNKINILEKIEVDGKSYGVLFCCMRYEVAGTIFKQKM